MVPWHSSSLLLGAAKAPGEKLPTFDSTSSSSWGTKAGVGHGASGSISGYICFEDDFQAASFAGTNPALSTCEGWQGHSHRTGQVPGTGVWSWGPSSTHALDRDCRASSLHKQPSLKASKHRTCRSSSAKPPRISGSQPVKSKTKINKFIA